MKLVRKVRKQVMALAIFVVILAASTTAVSSSVLIHEIPAPTASPRVAQEDYISIDSHSA